MTILNKDTAIILFYVLLFYSISLTLGFFSSYVLSKKNYNFRFPLFITSMQNFIHFILSTSYIYMCNNLNRMKRKSNCVKTINDTIPENIKNDNMVYVYGSPVSDNGKIDMKNANNSEIVDVQNNDFKIHGIKDYNKKIKFAEIIDYKNVKTINNNSLRSEISIYHKKSYVINPKILSKIDNYKNASGMGSSTNQDDRLINNLDENNSPELENLIDKESENIWSIPSYLITTIPCAITAAVDIGVSSHALRTVSLAFYTMIKSSAPVFVLLSGFLFGIEKPSISLFLTVFTIGSGVFLTTIKTDTVTKSINLCMSSTTFSLLFASFMAGFRWAFVQYLIEKRKVKKRSVVYTIKDLCLPICIILFGFSCYFEGLKNIIYSEFFQSEVAIRRNVGFIVLSGVLSFFLLVSEFLLVSKTSVVFLSVSGIVKELIIVFISVCKKDINFEIVNYGGLIVSIIGLLLYNYMRLRKDTDEEV